MSDNWYYVIAAYAVAWVALAGYRLFLRARRREAAELVRKEAQL
jgi:CcmD family protein